MAKKKPKNKREKAVITAELSALLRIVTEEGKNALWEVLKEKGKRKGSSIIIAAEDILPVLSEAAKWRWERKNDQN